MKETLMNINYQSFNNFMLRIGKWYCFVCCVWNASLEVNSLWIQSTRLRCKQGGQWELLHGMEKVMIISGIEEGVLNHLGMAFSLSAGRAKCPFLGGIHRHPQSGPPPGSFIELSVFSAGYIQSSLPSSSLPDFISEGLLPPSPISNGREGD